MIIFFAIFTDKLLQVEHEKKIIERPSVLSELFLNDKNMRSLHHICWIASFVTAINSLLISDHGFKMINIFFYGIILASQLWVIMMVVVLTAHFFVRKKLRCWRIAWYISFVFGGFIVLIIRGEEMGVGCRISLVLEQVRFLMKVHSYWHSASQKTIPTSMKKFIYFLFAPTLLYKAKYSQLNGPINWKKVVGHSIEFFSVIYLKAVIVELLFVPHIMKTSEERGLLSWRIFPTTIILTLNLNFLSHYVIFHTWQNIWAEILRFADRQFYGEWWSANNFWEYHRLWNSIVYDWLHEYVYSYIHLKGYSRSIAALTVFGISGIVHEYIIALTLRFFYPVMFAEFFISGIIITLLRSTRKSYSIGNCILLWFLFLGSAIYMIIFSLETKARKICPPYFNTFLDIFIPRSLYCENI